MNFRIIWRAVEKALKSVGFDISLSDLYNRAYDSENDREKVSIENDAVGLAKDSTLLNLKDSLNALKGANNKDFSTLEADVEGIKTQTDKLQFDDLLTLLTNRLDSLASLRKSLTIPEGSLYQVPEGQTVIVKDYVLAEGDLYVEGDLLVV